jgi:predicted enzyme related to lactoylglutathione lyase
MSTQIDHRDTPSPGGWTSFKHCCTINRPACEESAMPSAEPPINQALVLFAVDQTRVADFYCQTLLLDTIATDKTHQLLRGNGIEIVVHAISPRYARHITIEQPPVPRDGTAFKPVFVTDDLERVKTAAKITGGHLKPLKQAWQIRGATVLDGWDPEGNIVQFRQPAS